jgi:hypothetical protein
MKKSERMEEFIGRLDSVKHSCGHHHPCFLGYFECFNSGRYYEAHDVLEHLWITSGRTAPDYRFYKGLIQLAGGFVHLKLHHDHPSHPKHGRRLRPARRLFLLSMENLAPYASLHHGFEVSTALDLASRFVTLIEEGEFERNPWDLAATPRLPLPT